MPIAELPTPTPLPAQTTALTWRGRYEQWGRTLWQLVRFGLVGCMNTLVDLLTLNCLLWLWPATHIALLLLANSLAYATGALNSFLLNRYWTFQQRGPVRWREITRFAATTLAGVVCNDVILCLFNSLPHPAQFNETLWTNMTKIAAICGTLLISYLGMRLWVFVQSSQELPERATPTRRQQTLDEEQTAETWPYITSASLSLVLPAYNEEHVIATTVELAVKALEERANDFEIIVVNDGSTDRTGAILATLSANDGRIRVVTHSHNQGYGATLVDGFDAARKDLTFFMDSDGQFAIQDLDRLLPFVHSYDAVIGYRERRQDTWMRKLNAWGWKLVVFLSLGVRARDIDCAFKIVRTAFLRVHPLETRGAMINAELLYKLKLTGSTVKEVGVRHLPRQGGRATGANLRVIARAFRELFLYAYKWRQPARLAELSSLRSTRLSPAEPFLKDTAMPETEAISSLKDEKRLHGERPVRARLALAAVMLTSLFMNFYQLGQHGFGNLFYAAGVRSMADNLHNFFFVSYDPGGFVTVDKPPLGFWLQTLSVKLFGFTPFSIFFPQALAGVLAVLILFYLVRRHFGDVAGLLAALALALTPLSVATARNNTIDSVLVLVLLLAAWAVMLAAETGRLRWLLLSATLVGLGFNVKMMEAYLVVPAFGLLYLLAAPHGLLRRCGHLLLASLLLLAVSLSWACAVDLTPASQRPYVGSSPNNSEISLAFGYNGVDRLLGHFGFNRAHENAETGAQQSTALKTRHTPSLTSAGATSPEIPMANTGRIGRRAGGHGFGTDTPGPWRLFNQALGGQISWLLPLALLGMLALAWQRRLHLQKDRQQQALVLWGVWLLTLGVFFSVAGFFHTYYMTTLAPAICALAGIGVVVMWRDYRRANWRGWLLPLALSATAAEQIHFILSNPAWGMWLIPLIAFPCALAALLLTGVRLLSRESCDTRKLWPALALGLAALLLTPAIWSAAPALQNAANRTPSAGPSSQYGFAHRDAASASPALLHYLEMNQGNATFLVAAPSSQSANALILATNRPVMAMGGFAGRDPILTPAQLAQMVAQGKVRFFLLNNPLQETSSAHGHVTSSAQRANAAFSWFMRNSQPALTNWIKQHCSVVPAHQWQTDAATSSTRLYDCAADK